MILRFNGSKCTSYIFYNNIENLIVIFGLILPCLSNEMAIYGNEISIYGPAAWKEARHIEVSAWTIFLRGHFRNWVIICAISSELQKQLQNAELQMYCKVI